MVERARRGEGPALIEAKCARFQPHSGDDDDRYRAPEEIAALRRNDPVLLFRRRLIERGVFDEASANALAAELRATIDAATDAAEASPDPDPATLFDHVFAS